MLPSNTVDTEFSHEKKVHGKMVQYFHVWVKEKEPKPVFDESKEPDKRKIKNLSDFFKNMFE